MNKLIDQILELYFLGGNLQEILDATKDKEIKIPRFRKMKTEQRKFKDIHTQSSYEQMFSNWWMGGKNALHKNWKKKLYRSR